MPRVDFVGPPPKRSNVDLTTVTDMEGRVPKPEPSPRHRGVRSPWERRLGLALVAYTALALIALILLDRQMGRWQYVGGGIVLLMPGVLYVLSVLVHKAYPVEASRPRSRGG